MDNEYISYIICIYLLPIISKPLFLLFIHNMTWSIDSSSYSFIDSMTHPFSRLVLRQLMPLVVYWTLLWRPTWLSLIRWMNPSVHPPFFNYSFIHPYIISSIYVSFHPFIHCSLLLSINLPTDHSTCSFFLHSINLSIFQSVY